MIAAAVSANYEHTVGVCAQRCQSMLLTLEGHGWGDIPKKAKSRVERGQPELLGSQDDKQPQQRAPPC